MTVDKNLSLNYLYDTVTKRISDNLPAEDLTLLQQYKRDVPVLFKPTYLDLPNSDATKETSDREVEDVLLMLDDDLIALEKNTLGLLSEEAGDVGQKASQQNANLKAKCLILYMHCTVYLVNRNLGLKLIHKFLHTGCNVGQFFSEITEENSTE